MKFKRSSFTINKLLASTIELDYTTLGRSDKMSIYEIVMLICFGLAWPLSIYKSYTSKSIEGKSIMFLYVILLGYMSGILHKLIYAKDMVIILYIINGLMVSIDILLYFKNKKLIKQN